MLLYQCLRKQRHYGSFGAIDGSCFSNALLLPEADDEERNQIDDEEYDDGVLPAFGPHAAHHKGQTHACRRTYIPLQRDMVKHKTVIASYCNKHTATHATDAK